MSVEFVDTNVFVYAHDSTAGEKHEKSVKLLTRLVEDSVGALSVQVLCEFYSVATKKLARTGQEAEEIIADLAIWTIHRPGHPDVVRATRLHRRYGIGWWDALIINSAIELGCDILWSEDMGDGKRYGNVTVRNPYS